MGNGSSKHAKVRRSSSNTFTDMKPLHRAIMMSNRQDFCSGILELAYYNQFDILCQKGL